MSTIIDLIRRCFRIRPKHVCHFVPVKAFNAIIVATNADITVGAGHRCECGIRRLEFLYPQVAINGATYQQMLDWLNGVESSQAQAAPMPPRPRKRKLEVIQGGKE